VAQHAHHLHSGSEACLLPRAGRLVAAQGSAPGKEFLRAEVIGQTPRALGQRAAAWAPQHESMRIVLDESIACLVRSGRGHSGAFLSAPPPKREGPRPSCEAEFQPPSGCQRKPFSAGWRSACAAWGMFPLIRPKHQPALIRRRRPSGRPSGAGKGIEPALALQAAGARGQSQRPPPCIGRGTGQRGRPVGEARAVTTFSDAQIQGSGFQPCELFVLLSPRERRLSPRGRRPAGGANRLDLITSRPRARPLPGKPLKTARGEHGPNRRA